MNSRVADAIFWIAVVCCSVAQLAILRSVVAAPTDHDGGASSWRRAAEIAWAALPGIALAAVLFYTWRAMHPSLPVGARSAASLALGVVR